MDSASVAIPTVEAGGSGDRGSLQVDYGDLEVRVDDVRRSGAETGDVVALDVVRVGEVDAVAVEVDPPPFAIGVALAAEGSRGTVSQHRPGQRVVVHLEADPPPRPRWRTTSGRERRGSTSKAVRTGVGLRVHVDGLDEEPGPVTVWRDTDIIERRDFRYVYTWRATGLPPVLANRRCFSEAMANDEVVIFDVLPECQTVGAGRR